MARRSKDLTDRDLEAAPGRAGSPSHSQEQPARTDGPMHSGSVQRLQRAVGNAATRSLLVSRMTVEEEPAGPGSGQQAAQSSGGGLQLPASTTAAAPPGPATEAAPAPPTRMLRRGLNGVDVTEAQTKLNKANAATPALALDGKFGPLTDAAVRKYQTTHPPLVADGIVGPKTRASLDTANGGGGGGGGGGTGPVPVVDPLLGICTIAGHGASDGAVAAAGAQAIELYGGIAPASRAAMMADPVTVDVIPHAKKLTELAEYAHLAGTTTFDGRLWDDVRGIQTTVSGVRRVAVAEEDLVTVAGKAASYGAGFLEAHEGGHGLEASGLTPGQKSMLSVIYGLRLVIHGKPTATTPVGPATAAWLTPAWYSAANQQEYFANSVAAYHGHPYTNGAADVAIYNRAWLEANDPMMFALLQQVYAAPAAPTTTTPGGTP